MSETKTIKIDDYQYTIVVDPSVKGWKFKPPVKTGYMRPSIRPDCRMCLPKDKSTK